MFCRQHQCWHKTKTSPRRRAPRRGKPVRRLVTWILTAPTAQGAAQRPNDAVRARRLGWKKIATDGVNIVAVPKPVNIAGKVRLPGWKNVTITARIVDQKHGIDATVCRVARKPNIAGRDRRPGWMNVVIIARIVDQKHGIDATVRRVARKLNDAGHSVIIKSGMTFSLTA